MLLGLFLPVVAEAAALAPLPEPLTLDYALSLADEHPAFAEAAAAVDEGRADILAADALTGLNVSLEGRLRWVDPPAVAADQSHSDHAASLIVSKNLYDFGRSSASLAAAESETAGRRYQLEQVRWSRRIAVMRRYFDVLLADMRASRDDQAMAVVYVDLDKLRQRHELGQVSDLDVAQKQSEYQAARLKRAESEAEQRAARARLASAIGRPGMLSSRLSPPDLPQLKRTLPDYDGLLKRALADNPRLQALHALVGAAQKRVDAARATDRPRLEGVMEASAYDRVLGSSDRWRAGVNLSIPLSTGGAADAAVAKADAALRRARAQLSEAEMAVRQGVLDAWLELGTLGVAKDEVKALRDYRDLYLDRSRAIYEMEVKTDLGDAMVRMTEAQLAATERNFRVALAWARLDALTGRPIGKGSDGEGGKAK